MKTAAILIIGNEILSGRTRDANLQLLAKALGDRGVRLLETRVVADRFEAIVAGVNALRASYDFVFTTGGIGPTHDDITTECVAAAFGRRVAEDPEAVRRLVEHYGPEAINEARLRMAQVVAGATLIDNPVSAAPGFRVENVFVLPGVPRILEAMLEDVISQLPRGAPIASLSVTVWLRESEIASPLSAIQDAHPTVDIGSYPFVRDDRLGTSLVTRGTAPAAVAAAMRAITDMLSAAGAEFTVEPPA